MDVFNVAGLYGTACYKLINNRCHCFFGCGKIVLKDEQSGASILGYVVDEYATATGNNRWQINTAGGTIQMNALEEIGRFNYDLTVTTTHDGVTYIISEFQPARIIIDW